METQTVYNDEFFREQDRLSKELSKEETKKKIKEINDKLK